MAAGLNHREFTTKSPETLEGKVVAVKLGGSVGLFKATGGFGCSLHTKGTCIFVDALDHQGNPTGAKGRIDRYDVIAVKTDLPKVQMA